MLQRFNVALVSIQCMVVAIITIMYLIILCILQILFYGSKENTEFRWVIAIDNINSKPGHCWTEVTGQCIVWQTSMLWHHVNVFYDNPLYYDILSMFCMTTFYIMTSGQCIVSQPFIL